MLPDTMVCADWIISQALTAAENKCLPEAKSWLLTGVSIFPNNFQLKVRAAIHISLWFLQCMCMLILYCLNAISPVLFPSVSDGPNSQQRNIK